MTATLRYVYAIGRGHRGSWRARARLEPVAGDRLFDDCGVAPRVAPVVSVDIVQGLTSQAPGGEPLKPPSLLTIAARQLEGFGGSKALIVRGDWPRALM